MSDLPQPEILDYEELTEIFNQELVHTLRGHSVADAFLDYWVPDADPVLGIAGMADSARIAGHTQIAIRFHRHTIPDDRLHELENAIKLFAKVSFEHAGDSVLLRATEMTQDARGSVDPAAKSAAKATYWQAQPQISTGEGVPNAMNRWDSRELPEFADVHPDFRGVLKAALATVSHEGSLPPSDDVMVTGHEGAINLALAVDPKTHTVSCARHSGATKPSQKAALDLFCRAAEGLPIQEVADHLGLKIIDSMVDPDRPPPVGGILLPVNAGAPFTLAPRLARQAYDAYCTSTSTPHATNFYYAPPSAEWQALSPTIRREKVTAVLRGFLQSEVLYQDDIELIRLEKNKYGYEVRGVVGFSERVEVADKPFLMRRLEQRLKRDVEPEIELIADRAKDSSPLRRLS